METDKYNLEMVIPPEDNNRYYIIALDATSEKAFPYRFMIFKNIRNYNNALKDFSHNSKWLLIKFGSFDHGLWLEK